MSICSTNRPMGTISSATTLSITTRSIHATWHTLTTHYHYAECSVLLIVMLSVVILYVIMLSVVAPYMQSTLF